MQPTTANNNNISQRWLSHSGNLFVVFWLTILIVSISWGWLNRDQGFISAESGLGYWLGIIGGSLMLLLLTYSARKRLRILRRFLTVKLWFQFHMTLGIVGPLCVIFHSNFHLGSLNSTVALVCMLLVAGSGIIGRYFYNRIHFGLYGEKIKLQQAMNDFQAIRQRMLNYAVTQKQRDFIEKLFSAIESVVNAQNRKRGLFSLASNQRRAKRIAVTLKKFVAELERYHSRHSGESPAPLETINSELDNCAMVLIAILRKLPGLQLFERLFSLWHVFHIPIFVLMIGTAITHVVVVHMY